MKNTAKKLNTAERTRSMLLELPLPIADALDLAKVRRQQREGRIITKKELVREAVEKYLAAVE